MRHTVSGPGERPIYMTDDLITKGDRDRAAFSIEKYIRQGWVDVSLIGTYNISVSHKHPSPMGRVEGVQEKADWLLWLARCGKQLRDVPYAVLFSLEAFFWEQHYQEQGRKETYHGQEPPGQDRLSD